MIYNLLHYYPEIIVCAILSMVLGAIWYGPLFGKKWMEIIGATEATKEERQKMQKAAMPLYLIQFFLTLFQAFVLTGFLKGWEDGNTGALQNTLWIWSGFIIPTIAGACMWNNDSNKIKWARFLIQGGYQLALFLMFWLVLR